MYKFHLNCWPPWRAKDKRKFVRLISLANLIIRGAVYDYTWFMLGKHFENFFRYVQIISVKQTTSSSHLLDSVTELSARPVIINISQSSNNKTLSLAVVMLNKFLFFNSFHHASLLIYH